MGAIDYLNKIYEDICRNESESIHPKTIKRVQCHPDVVAELRKYSEQCGIVQSNYLIVGSTFDTLWGIPIFIDYSLRPGEWKIICEVENEEKNTMYY